MAKQKTIKDFKIPENEQRFDGTEPKWDSLLFDIGTRKTQLIKSLNWYHAHVESTSATKIILDYLTANQNADISSFKKPPEGTCPDTVAWLIRMTDRGWPIDDHEKQYIDDQIAKTIEIGKRMVKDAPVRKKQATNKVEEQLQLTANEADGQLDELLDKYIAEGAQGNHKLRPIEILKSENIPTQCIPKLVQRWESVREEFQLAYDGELKEEYHRFGKLQLRNLVKFADLIINDLNSYITFKKVSKTSKQKTPEQLISKLKYLKAFEELNLESQKPTKIIGASELFLYSTGKRKLQYYVADPHAGNRLSINGNTLVGFDPNKSMQKTIRKPSEQIGKLMAASKPDSRSFFARIKTLETKVSGRFADDLIILKVF